QIGKVGMSLVIREVAAVTSKALQGTKHRLYGHTPTSSLNRDLSTLSKDKCLTVIQFRKYHCYGYKHFGLEFSVQSLDFVEGSSFQKEHFDGMTWMRTEVEILEHSGIDLFTISSENYAVDDGIGLSLGAPAFWP
ncbi:hypothetical protein SK128_012926, partial [Halocaridina rubra]